MGGGDSGESFFETAFAQGAGGGGATHIATSIGELAELDEDKNAVVMVAAGGGGGASLLQDPGGLGGGLQGKVFGNKGRNSPGTQLATGENGGNGMKAGFGFGGEGHTQTYTNTPDTFAGAGGGSGWYGGGGSYANFPSSGGGAGGSSYVQTLSTLQAFDITPSLPLDFGFTASADEAGFIKNPNASKNGFVKIGVRDLNHLNVIFADYEQSDNTSGVVGIVGQTQASYLTTIAEQGQATFLQFDIGQHSKILKFDINGTEIYTPLQNWSVHTQTIADVGKVTLVNVKDRELVTVKLEDLQVLSVKVVAKLSHTVKVTASKGDGWVTSPTESFEMLVDNGESFDSTMIEGWTATNPDFLEFEIPSLQVFGYTELDVSDYAVEKESQDAPEFDKVEVEFVWGENDNELQLMAIGGNESIVYTVQSGDATVSVGGLVRFMDAGTIEIVAYRQATDTAKQSDSTVITITVIKEIDISDNKGSDSPGFITWIIVGSVVFVSGIVVLTFVLLKSKRKKI